MQEGFEPDSTYQDEAQGFNAIFFEEGAGDYDAEVIYEEDASAAQDAEEIGEEELLFAEAPQYAYDAAENTAEDAPEAAEEFSETFYLGEIDPEDFLDEDPLDEVFAEEDRPREGENAQGE